LRTTYYEPDNSLHFLEIVSLQLGVDVVEIVLVGPDGGVLVPLVAPCGDVLLNLK